MKVINYANMLSYLSQQLGLHLEILPIDSIREFLRYSHDVYLWGGDPKHQQDSREAYIKACNVITKFRLLNNKESWFTMAMFESFFIDKEPQDA